MNPSRVLFSALLMVAATSASLAATEPENNAMLGGVISGRIVDGDHQALPGATILVEDLHTGVTSDVNGFYALPNMKPGTYKVKVSYVGYSPLGIPHKRLHMYQRIFHPTQAQSFLLIHKVTLLAEKIHDSKCSLLLVLYN